VIGAAVVERILEYLYRIWLADADRRLEVDTQPDCTVDALHSLAAGYYTAVEDMIHLRLKDTA
jgi:hypothetical protein